MMVLAESASKDTRIDRETTSFRDLFRSTSPCMSMPDEITDVMLAASAPLDQDDTMEALEQTYFWTTQWQACEREADEDLRLHRFRDFDNVLSLLEDLDAREET